MDRTLSTSAQLLFFQLATCQKRNMEQEVEESETSSLRESVDLTESDTSLDWVTKLSSLRQLKAASAAKLSVLETLDPWWWPKLQVLIFTSKNGKDTKVTDAFISLVLRNCPDLKELRIQKARNLTGQA